MIQESNTVSTQDTQTAEGFGMEVSFAENAATWFEQTHQNMQQSLGAGSSFVLGLVGMLATGWLIYGLVIQAIPGIQFNIGTFHRPARHTALSALVENTYWTLHSLPAHLRRKTPLSRLPQPASAVFANFSKTVKTANDPALKRYLMMSLSAAQLHQHLQLYLQAQSPRANHYMAFFVKNFFRKDALHIDLALLFVRSLLLGFFLLFSVRLFFDNASWTKE